MVGYASDLVGFPLAFLSTPVLRQGVQSGRTASLRPLLPKRMAAQGEAIPATGVHHVFCCHRRGSAGAPRIWMVQAFDVLLLLVVNIDQHEIT